MNNSAMSDSYITSDFSRVGTMSDVNHRTILNVCPITNSNKIAISPDYRIKPKTNVLIVEDVITTGKSSLEVSKLVEKSNANIVGYACIIDRSNNESKIDINIVSQIELQILSYEEKDIPQELSKIKAVKPGSRHL